MPDSERKTVSASQVAEMLNLSPYGTRFTLFHWFQGVEAPDQSDERMEWGKRLQAVILAATSERLKLDVANNDGDLYQRHETLPLGATIDGAVFSPDRGPGIAEAKNVDKFIYLDQWSATRAPDHIEIQLATQMIVEDAAWGVIAALVGGNELILYMRIRNRKGRLEQKIIKEAGLFMADVKAGKAPSPVGEPTELETIGLVWPETPELNIVDALGDAEAAELMAIYRYADANAKSGAKFAKSAKAKLLAATKDAFILRAAEGWTARVKKSATDATLVDQAYIDSLKIGDTLRKASIRTTIKIEQRDVESATSTGTILDAG